MSVARSDDPDMFVWPPFCSNIAFELWSARPEDAPDKVDVWERRKEGRMDGCMDGRTAVRM
mgnify:CR=1 FL=1